MAQIISFGGYTPEIDPSAYIAESAVIIGHVTIMSGANIWPHTVIRGDESHIIIGKNVSIQDNSTVHTYPALPMEIGDNTLVGHNVILHGHTIGKGCLIGMGSILMDATEIGDETIIGAGTMITKHKMIPPQSLVYGTPARIIRNLTPEEIAGIQEEVAIYRELGEQYKQIQGE